MRTLLFATNNAHKIKEIKSAVGPFFRIVGLKESGIHIDIPEPHPTLRQNASEKSGTIFALTGIDCFSEDTGLEIDALGGEPGVRSARYAAGEGSTDEDNIRKVLANMVGETRRQARFKTVISLIFNKKEYIFEGICEGVITTGKRGDQGFGYDPIFCPAGSSHTFAEMDTEQKNRYSHRKKAADQLVSFLRKNESSPSN